MIRTHFGELFADDPDWRPRRAALSAKTWEILSFLSDVMQFTPKGVRYDGTASYHDSCSGLRDLGVFDQPRRMLADVAGRIWFRSGIMTPAAALAARSA